MCPRVTGSFTAPGLFPADLTEARGVRSGGLSETTITIRLSESVIFAGVAPRILVRSVLNRVTIMRTVLEIEGDINSGKSVSVEELKVLGAAGDAQRGNGRRLWAISEAITDARLRRLADAHAISDGSKDKGLLASEQRTFDGIMADVDAMTAIAEGFAMRNRRALRDAEPDNRAPAVLAGGSRGDTRVWLPSMREYRAQAEGNDTLGGYAVPEEVSSTIYDRLRESTIMLQPGRTQIVSMGSVDRMLPVLGTSATAGMTAENAEITSSDLTFMGKRLVAKKLGAIVIASSEVMNDALPDMRAFVERDLIRTAAATLDYQYLEGSGGGLDLRGVRNLEGATTTTLGAGAGAPLTADNVADAIARLRASNADASAIICAPRTLSQIQKLKDGEGRYLLAPLSSGAPAQTIFGVPVLTSSQVSITDTISGTSTYSWLAVVDWTQIVAGRRQDATLFYDPFSRSDHDQVLIRLTCRFAGLVLINDGGAQIVDGIAA